MSASATQGGHQNYENYKHHQFILTNHGRRKELRDIVVMRYYYGKVIHGCRRLYSIFLSCFFFLFSSPNLSSRRLDIYHTSTHDVVLVRILNTRLKCAARGSLKIQDAKIDHRTTLSGYIFTTKAYIDNGKNLLNSNIFSTWPHNMVNFGPLTTETGWWVWGAPANFNGVRVLALLLQRRRSTEVHQTLRDV